MAREGAGAGGGLIHNPERFRPLRGRLRRELCSVRVRADNRVDPARGPPSQGPFFFTQRPADGAVSIRNLALASS
jgi:hypothetical protein